MNIEEIEEKLRMRSTCPDCHTDYHWRSNCNCKSEWVLDVDVALSIINDALEKEGEQ